MDKYLNIDLHESYDIFESLDILSKSRKIKPDNLLQCKGVNCKGLIRKHQLEYDLPELKIGKIAGGYVCTSGFIYTKSGVIYSELQFNNEKVRSKIRQDKQYKIINTDKIVPLLRGGDNIYGHWLVDILPIVWLSRRVKDIGEYKYIVRNDIPSYALEFLFYFGVKESDLIQIDRQTKVNFNIAIYISNMRYNQIIHPMMQSFAIDLKSLILTASKDPKLNFLNDNINKIYLSRGEWKSFSTNKVRDLINRKEVESYFNTEKFDVIYPEKYNLVEQANIYSDIKILAGEDGSALHNSIFMNEGTKVICLKGKKNHSIIQGALCFVMGQKISYVLGDINSEPINRNSSYKIQKKHLESIFEEK